ncbi:hypothetical protein [Motiliproteus sediminis]|uniref:hypothetical protein n=1 Tax=Motiliproteus sediminis TaxID=1468178 RepID=UPI001AEF7403|nr:hypothetical protein [Motiliproteus sediminis]
MTPLSIVVKPVDGVEAQAQLDALPGSDNNNFKYNIWKFSTQRDRVITIDFNALTDMGESYPRWPLARTIDWVLLTKRIWLSLALSTTPNSYQNRFKGLTLFWETMGELNVTELSRDNCREVLEFLLMHSRRHGILSKNLKIKSYALYGATIQINAWKIALIDLDLNWIQRSVTESFVNKELHALIPSLTNEELTYRDWTEGGSYNLLTLDHGRYYVEHCLSFFEKQYPLALALASTFEAIPALATSLGNEFTTVSQVTSLALQGCSLEHMEHRWPKWSRSTLERIHKRVTLHFKAAYQQALFEAALLNDSTLEDFIETCGVPRSPENIDRMRIIIWDWLHRNDKKETCRLLSEGLIAIPWAVFEKQLNAVKKNCYQQPCPIPSAEYYEAIGLDLNLVSKNHSHLRLLISMVTKAGLTSAVALTGWRKSELGFPHTAIKRTRNDDKLDQYAFPWRYHVDWYVYKTSGKVRQLREITFSIFSIAERLRALLNANIDQPCLYRVTSEKKNPSDSRLAVLRSVRYLWGHFVSHYSGFQLLDDWEAWQVLQQARRNNKPLTAAEQETLQRLLLQRSADEWTHLRIDVNLKEAWRRARDEWPRLELFLSQYNKKNREHWLIRYRDQTLRPDWCALLDAYLPNETKDWIQSLSEEELKSHTVAKVVIADFIEGTLYPSPHAFRHMWAEAVYRRFDGDAGWMIRSQFKHITRAMWLSYIRDKDNRFGHERAKAQVISSLVHNYLRHKGEGYAGQLHTWLRRLLNQTSVLTPEEQEQLAERLATLEIENIKANPWGYCLLKRRTLSKARCAEMGEPMRHNASPDLCLGCTHNLMQTENVDWALFHVAPHVDAMKNPIVPAVFKESSYKLVKNVTRHVRTLNPQHEALKELEEVLGTYKASRAA